MYIPAFADCGAARDRGKNYVPALTLLRFTLTLILTRENARTNADLAHNLAEAKALSVEKEQLLTRQKATLEQQVTERTAALNQSLMELRAT